MNKPIPIGVGCQLSYQGTSHEVIMRRIQSVSLRELATGEITEIALNELLSDLSFGPISRDEEVDENRGWSLSTYFDLLADEDQKLARQREEDLLEAQTGFRSGNADEARKGEPRAKYDVTKVPSVEERYRTKAKEISARPGAKSVSKRQLFRWAKDYKEQGLLGLVDERKIKRSDPLASLDPRFTAELQSKLEEYSDRSNVTADKILGDVRRALEERHGAGVVPIPSKSKFYKVHGHLTRHDPAYSARTRRNNAGRTKRAHNPLRATRPGEVIQIDCTRVDVLVIDPVSGKIARPEIAVAIDAYSRCVLGARMDMISSDGIDAALLLHDVMSPKRAEQGWPEQAHFAFAGVPEKILHQLDEPQFGDEAAAIPFVWPETTVVDHGRIFMSETFLSACELLQISLQPAPPKTPHYKGIIERFMDTLNTRLWQHVPGHTGRNTIARGQNPEADDLLFLHELEALFFDFIASVYHHTPHEGCRISAAPGQKLTPKMMFEQGLQRGGFIMAMPDPGRILGLLPTEWRVIRPEYRVLVDHVQYWSQVLERWIGAPSPYSGKGNKFPFHVDSRDRSKIWFQDPDTHQYHPIPRISSEPDNLPFHEAMIHWAKRRLTERGENEKDPDQLEGMLDDLLRRHSLHGPLDSDEERIVRQLQSETAEAAADTGKASSPKALPARGDGAPSEDRPEADDEDPGHRDEGEDAAAPDPLQAEDDQDDWFDDVEPLGRLE